ncbi:MAG: DegT/DnrJ/EryC1/StrS family aminotransferase [Chitinophagales bacterium]
MINVTETFLPPLEEYQRYLEGIWETKRVTNEGALAVRLEEQLRHYLGVPHLSYVSNGTIALQIALKALGVTGEVITTPYSYVATTNSILWENCRPVFVDVDESTFCIDPRQIEAAITEKTTAILATHVYGLPCDVDAIARIGEKHGLKVIYDAAHCFGVRLNGQSLLNFGDVSTISFHATKVFHTVEGGGLVTRDPELARRISLLKKFGHYGEDNYYFPGINGKNTEFHAAMGLCLLPRMAEVIAYRRAVCESYDRLLAAVNVRRLTIPPGVEHNYAYYPVIFRSSQQALATREALIRNDVLPRRYFYPSLNQLPFVTDGRPCPVSESLAQRVLCLPLYYGLRGADVARIAEVIADSCEERWERSA